MRCVVKIEVNDPQALADDRLQGDIYGDLTTAQRVLEHFAYNAVYNGIDRASRLDGWVDLDPDAVRMTVLDVEPD